MDSQFQRILSLVRRTGDRMVVTDQNGKDVYVVMGLDQYEHLLDDAELGLETAGDDSWTPDDQTVLVEAPSVPSAHEAAPVSSVVPESTQPSMPPQPPKNIFEVMSPAGSSAKTWNIDEMNPRELSAIKQAHEQTQHPPTQAMKDTQEEQYYLEPIE